MNGDAELLRQYAAERSEAAFAELVRRNVDLVYSAAFRVVGGDVHRAQDVTQQVFTELARQAGRLSRHPALAGWLYTTARRTALRAIRTETRRTHREHEAMNHFQPALEPEWDRLRPVLEEAMHELNEPDRLALLLRFFQNKALKDVGLALGLNENAARMRIERALEKLRAQLARHGVTSTTSALVLALSGNAVAAAPPAFVATLAAASLAGASTGSGAILTALKIMSFTKAQLGLVGVVAVLAAVPLALQFLHNQQLAAENQRQAAQLARLTADATRLSNSLARAQHAIAVADAAAGQPASRAADNVVNNRVARLLPELMATNANFFRLKTAQLETYLDQQKRNAGSLVAAYRATGDTNLLLEAMQKFPNDPFVEFAAVFKPDATPEVRREWIESLKQSAPDNAMANYLSALDYFKSGQPAQAIQEINAVAGKSQFQDYSTEFVQNGIEVYTAAGYSPAEAEEIATSQLLLPQLAQLKQLNQNMVDLANSYNQAGDTASAQSLLQADIQLGQRFNEGPGEALISSLVGIAIQKIALNAMDPSAPYGQGGQTVAGQIAALNQQRSDLQDLGQQMEAIEPNLTDEDWISYKNRWMLFGEQNALHWVINKYAAQ